MAACQGRKHRFEAYVLKAMLTIRCRDSDLKKEFSLPLPRRSMDATMSLINREIIQWKQQWRGREGTDIEIDQVN